MDEQNKGGGAEFTDAQVDKLQQIIGSIVSGSIAARDRQADKKRQQDMDAIKSEFAKMLESAKTASGGGGKTDPGEGDGPGGKGRRYHAEEAVQLNDLKAKMADMSSRYDDMMRKYAEERQKNRSAALRASLSDALAKRGVTDPFKIKHAGAVLIDSEKRVDYEDDESQQAIFRADDGSITPLDTGLGLWFKSDEGKHFLPAAGARGSGSRPSQGMGSNGQQMSREAGEVAVFEALATQLDRMR